MCLSQAIWLLIMGQTLALPGLAAVPALCCRLQGISDADVGTLQGVLDEGVQENLGMAMIYTLISSAQEWVQEKAASMAVPSSDPVLEEKRRRDAEDARLAELRRGGQPVTPEAFAAWRAKFEAEQAQLRAKLEGVKVEEKQTRLTGKQYFLQQEAQHLEVRTHVC